MKIRHYCPKCKLEKEVEGPTANLKAMWKYHFGEDYDFFKSKQQNETKNKWLIEKVKIYKEMNDLMNKSAELEKKFYKYKDFRELIRINRDLNWLKTRYEYKEKESNNL